MYRGGFGRWEQIENYCERLKAFREATTGYSIWVKSTMAELLNIPSHHIN